MEKICSMGDYKPALILFCAYDNWPLKSSGNFTLNHIENYKCMFLVNGNNPEQYDVLILFSMRNKPKVMKVVLFLESDGLRVCLPERDLLAGLSLTIVIPELITERYFGNN